MTTALIIIDMQQGMFTDVVAPHRGEAVIERCAELLSRARAAGTPVFLSSMTGRRAIRCTRARLASRIIPTWRRNRGSR